MFLPFNTVNLYMNGGKQAGKAEEVAGDFCIPAAIFMQIFVTGQKMVIFD